MNKSLFRHWKTIDLYSHDIKKKFSIHFLFLRRRSFVNVRVIYQLSRFCYRNERGFASFE
jgi:hypothetical protein